MDHPGHLVALRRVRTVGRAVVAAHPQGTLDQESAGQLGGVALTEVDERPRLEPGDGPFPVSRVVEELAPDDDVLHVGPAGAPEVGVPAAPRQQGRALRERRRHRRQRPVLRDEGAGTDGPGPRPGRGSELRVLPAAEQDGRVAELVGQRVQGHRDSVAGDVQLHTRCDHRHDPLGREVRGRGEHGARHARVGGVDQHHDVRVRASADDGGPGGGDRPRPDEVVPGMTQDVAATLPAPPVVEVGREDQSHADSSRGTRWSKVCSASVRRRPLAATPSAQGRSLRARRHSSTSSSSEVKTRTSVPGS